MAKDKNNTTGVSAAIKRAVNKDLRKAADPASKSKKKAQGRVRFQKAGAVNSYLELLLAPEVAPLVGIPDQVTLKSVKMRTKHRFVFTPNQTTAAQTWGCLAISPGLTQSSVLEVGGNASGSVLTCISQGALALAISNPARSGGAGGTAYLPVSANEALMMRASCNQIRPVAMSVSVVCTGPALSITGEHGMFLADAETILGGDTVASTTNGFFASSTFKGLPGVAPGFLGSVDSVLDCCDVVTNVSEPLRCIWSPEDNSDSQYFPITTAAADAFNEWNTTTWRNTTLPEDDSYLLPFGVYKGTLFDLAATSVVETARAENMPSIVWVGAGLVPGITSSFEFTVTVTWEGLPNPAYGNVLGASPSPENPDEQTQADNIMAMIPNAVVTTAPSAPENQIQMAAMKAATHLYDGTERKSAIEGSSIIKGLGAATSVAAPLLGLIPGVGAPLAAGAGLLGGLLGSIG